MSDTEKSTGASEGTTGKTEHVHRFETEAKTVGPCKIEVTIRVPVETIRSEFDERYKEVIKTVAFPGFRLGHAPRKLVERKVGAEVKNEVREHLVSESFKEALEKHEIDALADPDIDLEALKLEPDQPLEYKAVFLVRPTVTLPDYSTVSVTAAKAEVSEEKVEAVLAGMRRRHAVLTPKTGEKVAEGDVVVVDVRATVGEDKVVERENVQYEQSEDFLAGLHLPGLSKAILGRAAEEKLTLTEKLPETWPQAEQAGKEMNVEIAVREVKRYVLPELDDAFASKLDYDTLDELRAEIRGKVARAAEEDAKEVTDRRIVDALIVAAPFEIPEDIVKEETAGRVKRLQTTLRMEGSTDEEVERKVAEASAAQRSEAERDFRGMFLLDAVAKKEKILVTETEVKERITRMAASYHRSVEEMEEYVEQHDMLSSIRNRMREEKVLEFLRGKVKIES